MSILILGDGNFSFSMALAQQLTGGAKEVVATSFDDSAAIKRKYPEAEGFLQRIRAAGGRTAHAVNAVQLPLSAESGVSDQGPVQHVIFHHPHLGVEDMRHHRALLGHFFHSAAQQCVLAPRGVIHVSVGGRQAEDWQLQEQAARHGLTLLLQTPFPTQELRDMGYEKKRHQAGRAFETAALCSTNYSFGRAADFKCDSGRLNSLGEVSLLPKENPPWLWNQVREKSNNHSRRSHSDTATPDSLGVSEQHSHINGIAPAKSGAQEAPESSSTAPGLARNMEAVQWYKCSQCDRVFKCKRGLKSHEHMVHTLAAVTSSARPRFRCSACGESFTHRRAAQQHMQSSAACQCATLVYLRAGDDKNAPQTTHVFPQSTNMSTVMRAADAHGLGATATTCETEAQSCSRSSEANNGSAQPWYTVQRQDESSGRVGNDTSTMAYADAQTSAQKAAGLGRDRHKISSTYSIQNDVCHPAQSPTVCDSIEKSMDADLAACDKELQADVVTCEICGLQFASNREEAEHWEWLMPKEETWQCQNCSKCFVNERALRQHSAVCFVAAGAC